MFLSDSPKAANWLRAATYVEKRKKKDAFFHVEGINDRVLGIELEPFFGRGAQVEFARSICNTLMARGLVQCELDDVKLRNTLRVAHAEINEPAEYDKLRKYFIATGSEHGVVDAIVNMLYACYSGTETLLEAIRRMPVLVHAV
jgi:hypothetical protein